MDEGLLARLSETIASVGRVVAELRTAASTQHQPHDVPPVSPTVSRPADDRLWHARPATPSATTSGTALSAEDLANTITPSVPRVRPPTPCTGCANFPACLSTAFHVGAAFPDEWMKAHDIVRRGRCSQHGAIDDADVGLSYLTGVSLCIATLCMVVRSGNSNKKKCLHKIGEYGSFLTISECVHGNNAENLFNILRLLPLKACLSLLARVTGLHRNTVRSVYLTKVMWAMGWAYARLRRATKFTDCQVDETHFGSRKYNRGKRARKDHYWCVTLTQGDVTIWELVEKRGKATLTAIIAKYMDPDGWCTVITDGWRGYNDVKSIPCVRRHEVVIHKKKGKKASFVNANGFTTNAAEGCHGAIKKTIKQVFYNYGRTCEQLQTRIAFACLFFCKDQEGRFRVLLEAVKDWNGIAYVFDEVKPLPSDQRDPEDPEDEASSSSSDEDDGEELAMMDRIQLSETSQFKSHRAQDTFAARRADLEPINDEELAHTQRRLRSSHRVRFGDQL